MKKFTKKMLLEHLSKSDKQEIINEILVLFEKFENVKEYYVAELSDTNPLLESYKNRITKAYAADNPSERRTNMNVNKLISKFKKVSIYQTELVELHFHRVQCGIGAFNKSEKRSETFYNSILNSFIEALKILEAENAIGRHKQTIASLIRNSHKGKFLIKERMEQAVVNYAHNFFND